MTAAGNAINMEVKLQVPGLTERMLLLLRVVSQLITCWVLLNHIDLFGQRSTFYTSLNLVRLDFLLQNSGETGSFAVWQIQGGAGDVLSRHSTF